MGVYVALLYSALFVTVEEAAGHLGWVHHMSTETLDRGDNPPAQAITGKRRSIIQRSWPPAVIFFGLAASVAWTSLLVYVLTKLIPRAFANPAISILE